MQLGYNFVARQPIMNAGTLIATILRHDKKVASYKIALIRSINDVVLGFPHIGRQASAIAIPLRTLARFWVAYYWPFADAAHPILQAQKSIGKEDVSFRPVLTRLRREWEQGLGISSQPADGYFLVGEYLSGTRWRNYPETLRNAFSEAVVGIVDALQQPIRYAGPGQYSVFAQPACWQKIQTQSYSVVCLPETRPTDVCIVVEIELWNSFCELSLWVEALCIHEWCLFTENLAGVERGVIYGLLTDRPENRRPLTWERNQVEILMMEEAEFACPWTGKKLTPASYDLDHLLPVSVYPINELWNIVPANRQFNQHVKRDRMPGAERLSSASPRLQMTYENYLRSPQLSVVLTQDMQARFGSQGISESTMPAALTRSIVDYLQVVTASRNLRVF